METLTIDNFLTLFMLVMLQAVLGFDNLLYISLESKHAPEGKQKYVGQVGIAIAIFLRIALLFILINVIDLFQTQSLALTCPSFMGISIFTV